jgi:hypothetical protein
MHSQVQYLLLRTISKKIPGLKKITHFYKTKSRFMNKFISLIIFLIVFILSPAFVQTTNAQPPNPDPKEIPIDGGLGVLLAAGVAYAAKKLYKQRDEETE